MAEHTHMVRAAFLGTPVNFDKKKNVLTTSATTWVNKGEEWVGGDISPVQYTGNNTAHNNLQPTIAAYGWKRTA